MIDNKNNFEQDKRNKTDVNDESSGLYSPETQEKSPNSLLKVLDLIFVFIAAIFLPKLACYICDKVFPFGSMPWLYLHHILQLIFALIIMIIPVWGKDRKSLKNWGFNFNESKWTFQAFLKFALGWLICLTIGTLITEILSGWPWILDFEATPSAFFENLLFSATMPGISEEIVFRAMVIGILSRRWTEKINLGDLKISLPNLFAAIIFACAHIGFTLIPFQITSYNIMQLAFCFFLGLLYGAVLEKTKSLLGPVLMHNASDAIGITIYYIITLIFIL